MFECSLDNAQYVRFQHALEGMIDLETDSLRFYQLGTPIKIRSCTLVPVQAMTRRGY